MSDKTSLEHAYSPCVYDEFKPLKLGYMFGDPFNSVLSIFRRNYQDEHARVMCANSGVSANRLKGVSLEGYLERGVDEFYYQRQFDNWVKCIEPKHPIILIKYETLGENIDEVLDFFQCKRQFKIHARRSSWRDAPKKVQQGLANIYGELQAEVDGMPGVRVLRDGLV